MKTVLYTFTLLCFFSSGAAEENSLPSLNVVPSVDLQKYAGTWYEIARLPNPFQERCTSDVTATYAIDGDELVVINRCRTENGEMTEAKGRARRADDDGPNSKLEVRFAPAFLSFLPFVWGDYWILELPEDYSYVVIGEPERKYLWILAREKTLPGAVREEIFKRITMQGYDIKNLVYTTQSE